MKSISVEPRELGLEPMTSDSHSAVSRLQSLSQCRCPENKRCRQHKPFSLALRQLCLHASTSTGQGLWAKLSMNLRLSSFVKGKKAADLLFQLCLSARCQCRLRTLSQAQFKPALEHLPTSQSPLTHSVTLSASFVCKLQVQAEDSESS